MSESGEGNEAAGVTGTSGSPAGRGDGPRPGGVSPSPRTRLGRRSWTLLLSGALVLAFALIGTLVRVPYVALGPGPTYDTLGAVDGHQVVSIDGHRTYPTDGQLRMTTVSLNDHVTLFGALALWVSGRYAVAPREEYFRPGESDAEVKRENAQQFQNSQSNAEVAALRSLGYPVKVVVREVVPGSPAEGELAVGDQVIGVNGKRVTSADDVRDALRNTHPGQRVSITFQRDDQPERTESVTLARHPQGEQGFIGFQPVDRADVPFKVDIALEDVGGPSAGLMFALAIVDRMTPGDLAGGHDIAGTGEISPTGQVGPIGGISFKLVAAREAGATAFLVPEQNCAEAVAAAPEGLTLIKVSDLDGAVHALENLDAGRPTPTCEAR